jgi:hypothetical protein
MCIAEQLLRYFNDSTYILKAPFANSTRRHLGNFKADRRHKTCQEETLVRTKAIGTAASFLIGSTYISTNQYELHRYQDGKVQVCYIGHSELVSSIDCIELGPRLLG